MARVLLAAAKSGSGKTMISCGLMRLLSRRGMKVQGMKCGPDYIDPMFHRKVLGIPSGNLDTFFTDKKTTRMLLDKREENADITVVEGVMGYYDGLGGVSVEASTYDVAVVTDTPVILIVDAKGASVTLAAMIKGIIEFRKDSNIKGILLNRVSAGFYQRIKAVIEAECKVPVIGFLPEIKDLKVPSRHLGLVSPEELQNFTDWADQIADELEKNVEIEVLLNIANTATKISVEKEDIFPKYNVKIAIAMDEAFSFYYEENRMLLKELGATLIPFSPIHDAQLPQEIGGIILGGGYPENYAKELMENVSMREDIERKCKEGMPVIAECGGFLYLQKELQGADGRIYAMSGVLNGNGFDTGKLCRFGYAKATIKSDGLLGKAGTTLFGHEFHHWDVGECGKDFQMEKPRSEVTYDAVFHTKTMAVGFPHFYYYSNKCAVENFLKACEEKVW